ncbi:MAG: phage major capsid protein [Gemmatimonadetes bacterium]|nr:phage major capsid protein [Gemmatimonadota bacterium]
MLESQKIELRRSRVRERLGEIAALAGDDYSEAIQTEETALQGEYTTLERRHRSAIIAEDSDLEARKAEAGDMDGEQRERIELRSKARLTEYLTAHARGRLAAGAEAELQAAAGVSGIPIELWDVPAPELRAVTGAPATVGVNLDPIRPAVFASSIAPRLGIDMPRVSSGTYATATITTSTTAAAKAKSAAIEATAGEFTVTTATPKRVSARLELTLEDIAAVGAQNFESILRQNLSLALSDALDNQAINGDGTAPNLRGMVKALEAVADPADPTAVPDFDAFVAAFVDSIDGLWASTVRDVAMVAGVATYRLAAKTFRDIASADLGAITFADYAAAHFGGWWTNKRMPAAASNIQRGIVYRKGRSMRTAVCPHWGEVSIDDVYTGSAKAERYFTMHVLLGDVILVQPDAYALREFKVA